MADPEFFPLIHWVRYMAQAMAILVTILSILIFYDVLFLPSFVEKGIVIDKYISNGKGNPFCITVRGKNRYNETVDNGFTVDKDFYKRVHKDDDVILYFTGFLKQIKYIELISSGEAKVKSKFLAKDLCFFVLLFFLPLASFKKEEIFQKDGRLLVLILATELVAIIVLAGLLLFPPV